MPSLSSVEVVGGSFRLRDIQGENAIGFYGDHIVLILQDALDHYEFFANQQQTVFLEHAGGNDGVGNAGFILQAEEDETFGGARTLANDDTAGYTQALPVRNSAEFAGAANAQPFHLSATVRHGMWSNRIPDGQRLR